MQLLSRLLPSTLYLVVSCSIDKSLFILSILFNTFSCFSITTSHVFKLRNPSVGFLSLISSFFPYKLIYKLSTSFQSSPVSPTLFRNTSDQLHLDSCSEFLLTTRLSLSAIYISPFINRCPSEPLPFSFDLPAKVFSSSFFGALGFAQIYFGLLRTSVIFHFSKTLTL
jgi:hypothetical protein